MGEEPKKGMGWKGWLFLGVITLVLLGLIKPILQNAQIAGRRVGALSNCKAIAGGLVTFKTDLGHYPCPATREILIKKGATNLSNGTDANAYLAQLIVTEVIDSETYFHCEAGKGYHKGDDLTATPTQLLAPGENSYAYIMAQGEKPLTPTESITPLVITPITSGGSNPTFDPDLFGSYYVYASADGSGNQGRISPTGQALSKGRTSLFQTRQDSLFGDQIPDVKIPTRKY